MPKVYRRPLAALDILDTWDHIADNNMAAADRWVDELDAALGRLATQPMMGRARPELAPDLRSFPFKRYVIYYVPRVRVLHSARDVDGKLVDEK